MLYAHQHEQDDEDDIRPVDEDAVGCPKSNDDESDVVCTLADKAEKLSLIHISEPTRPY